MEPDQASLATVTSTVLHVRDIRPYLVGEAPSRTGDSGWEYPLWGRPTRRLLTWLEMDTTSNTDDDEMYRILLTMFRPVNLLQRWPGRSGVGSAFPRSEAGEAWSDLRLRIEGVPVILLGRRLAHVSGIQDDWRVWSLLDGTDHTPITHVPHPSGLTRTYNDSRECSLTGATLREGLWFTGSDLGVVPKLVSESLDLPWTRARISESPSRSI